MKGQAFQRRRLWRAWYMHTMAVVVGIHSSSSGSGNSQQWWIPSISRAFIVCLKLKTANYSDNEKKQVFNAKSNLIWNEPKIVTEETHKVSLHSLLPAVCPLSHWSTRDGIFHFGKEKLPAAPAALTCIQNIFPQSGPAKSVLSQCLLYHRQDLILLFYLFVCVPFVYEWKPESMSSVSCNLSPLWVLRIQTQVLLLVWQALYQLSYSPNT